MARQKRDGGAAVDTAFGSRYLLYIDILGFEQLASADCAKVERIYRILDSLNAHRHPNFKAIAFSDTILIYNPEPVTNREDAQYIVWYLIEFAEDLHRRFTGQDLFFRAVLVSGEFNHYRLENVECFFGQALIEAYKREKDLPAIGLFITEECNTLNQYFRTARFDDKLSFVFLSRGLQQLHDFTSDVYPAPYPEVADVAPNLPWDVKFLKDVYTNMRSQPSPAVRAKYLAVWDFYSQRHPGMLKALVDGAFALSSLAYEGAWREEQAAMLQDIRNFVRVNGSRLRH